MTFNRNIQNDRRITDNEINNREKSLIKNKSWLGHTKYGRIIDYELLFGGTVAELAEKSGRKPSGVVAHISHLKSVHGLNISNNNGIYKLQLNNNESDGIYEMLEEIENEKDFKEGKLNKVYVNSFERNKNARQNCIEYFGINCQVCGFNFEEKFGNLGIDFIHVHHKIDISTIGTEYSVNPKKDLIPVCPNCHSMLHKRKPAFSIEELKEIIEERTNANNV